MTLEDRVYWVNENHFLGGSSSKLVYGHSKWFQKYFKMFAQKFRPDGNDEVHRELKKKWMNEMFVNKKMDNGELVKVTLRINRQNGEWSIFNVQNLMAKAVEEAKLQQCIKELSQTISPGEEDAASTQRRGAPVTPRPVPAGRPDLSGGSFGSLSTNSSGVFRRSGLSSATQTSLGLSKRAKSASVVVLNSIGSGESFALTDLPSLASTDASSGGRRSSTSGGSRVPPQHP